MTALRFLGAVPAHVWIVLGAFVGVWLYGKHEYRRGQGAAQAAYEQQQRRAADAAGKEVDRVLRGDRSGVVQFDRD